MRREKSIFSRFQLGDSDNLTHPRRAVGAYRRRNCGRGSTGGAVVSLWRKLILPFVKSYGVISTVTRSPARIRIRFFFILPEEYASVSWPLSSRTLNRASGNSSITMPSNSTRSSLANEHSHEVKEKRGAP